MWECVCSITSIRALTSPNTIFSLQMLSNQTKFYTHTHSLKSPSKGFWCVMRWAAVLWSMAIWIWWHIDLAPSLCEEIDGAV